MYMNVSTRTSHMRVPIDQTGLTSKNSLSKLPRQVAKWLSCMLVVLACWTSQSFAQVTVTNPGNTTPGLAATYPDLAAAVADLNLQTAISGPVTIAVDPANPQTAPAGGYSITAQLTGASGTNLVTFEGNGNTITAPTPQATGILVDAIFKFVGADFMTLQNFVMNENAANTTTAAATNNMTEFGVAVLNASVTNGSQNITILNNTITLNRTYQNTFGVYSNASHSATSITVAASATSPAGAHSNLTIHGNNISNVNMGIVVVGSTTAANMNSVVDIGGTSVSTGNTITNYGTTGTFSGYLNVSGTVNGILVRNVTGINISYNTVTSSVGGVTSGTLNGIQVPNFSVNPTGTFTNNFNNNNISLRSAVAAGAMNGLVVGTSATVTSTVNINNNNFGPNFGHTVVASGAITYINNSNGALALTTNINSNTFTNMTVNTTGTVIFIGRAGNIPSGSAENVNNNSIVTQFTKTGSGGSVVGYTANASSVNGSTMTQTGNNFSNVNIVGTTAFTGWSNTDGASSTSGPTKVITGNTFSNISATGIIVPGGSIFGISVNFSGANTTVSNNTVSNLSGGGTVVGISHSTSNGTGTHTVANNIVSNLTSSGQGTGGVGAINGIQAGSTSIATLNLNNNTVTGLTTVGASQVNGIISTAGTTVNIFKNTVCNVESNNASGTVNGIAVTAGTTMNVYNNRVADLRTPVANAAWPLIGINTSGGTNLNVYYNSVYLNGTSSGAVFGSTAMNASATSNLDMRNNLFYNTSTSNTTGLTVAYRRSAVGLTTYAATSNRNDFVAANIFTDGTTTHTTLAGYQAFVAPRDAASISEVPNFLSTACGNANFLKIDGSIASLLESGGVNVGGITDDFENDIRQGNVGYVGSGNAPDIGADEFAGTSPAPIITMNLVTPPDASLCSATARLVSVTATTPSGSITGVTITYNNGTLNSNVPMTNTSGNIWEYTIPAASPTNTSVSWSATATNSLSLTASLTGAGYQDDPLFGALAAATANPTTVCAGSPSVLTASISFTSPAPGGYCAATFSSTTEDDIGQVTFAGINNPAVRPAQQNNAGATGTYTDFTAIPAAAVAAGGSYPITVFHTHDGTDASANFSNVYIDFNQNGVLSDAGEVFSLTKVGGAFLTDFTGTIAIPVNAKPGNTRMRVIVREGAITSPCGTVGTWGEVEDYIVNVSPAITAITWSDGTNTVGSTNPLTVNPTVTTTYSATLTALGCPITTTTNATVTADPLPAQPLATNGSQCGVGIPTTTFVATGGQSGTFRWYDAATGGNLLQTGGTTYTGSISATTIFWVSEDNGPTTCESVRTQVTATVNPPDTVQASVNSAAVCLGSSITLTATKTSNLNGNNYVYTWTAVPQPGSDLPVLGTVGSPITITPTAAGTYVYTVSAVDGVQGCATISTVNVTINALPVIDSLTATPAALCNGGSTTLNVYSGVTTSGPNGLPATYCVPAALGSADITTVIFNTLSNTSIVQVSPFYDIYPASGSTTTTVSRGETYPMTLATTGATIISVWIDYNRDGIFDASEWTQPWTNNNSSTVNITIPVTASLGQTGMRIRTRLAGNANAATDACSSFGSGVSQDYTITINNVVKQNPAYTYAWMDLLNATSIGTNSPTVAGVTPNTPPSMDYSVSITDANGCVSIDTITVVVNAVPPAPTGTDGDQCGTGIPTTTSVSSGSGAPTPIFKWYDAPTGGNLLQTGTSNTYTSSISVTTTFYVSEISAEGCEGPRSTVLTATVNQPDEITVSSSTGAVACFGEQFAVSSSYTANINNFNNFVLTAIPEAGSGITNPVTLTFTGAGSDPYNITPSAAGVYQYIITADESGNCISADTITITVNALPVLDSVTATPAVICAGATVQLNGYSLSYANGPQTLPTGYGASFPSQPDDEDLGNVTFGTINNTSTCATTGGGLSVLNVYSDYTGTVTPATVYGGQSVPFSVSSITCGGNWANRIAIFIDYNRDGDFTDAGENAYLEPTSTTGPHTVSGNIVIPINASAGLTMMRVIDAEATGLNPTPIIDPVNGANEYAWGETEDYTINIQAAVLQNPALTYTWNTVPATTPFTGNPASVTPSTTTTYELVATDAAGCASAASQVTVTVNPVPTTPTATNASQCGLKVPTASVTSTSGFGTPTFNWYDAASGGTLLQSSTSTTYTTAISATTTFYVSEIVLATGCESPRVAVTVTVTNPPALVITPGGATTFCSGGSVSLDASAAPTDPSYINFSWTPATEITPTNAAVVTASPTVTRTYTVVADDGVSGPTGCSNSANITITVNPNPVIDSLNATPATICATGSATLNVYSPSVGAGPQTTPGYALPGTTGNTSGDNITLSEFATMSNPNAGGAGVNGYEDFTTVDTPTVNLNTAYNLTVHVADGGTERAAAWIDWNRNGVYESSEFYNVPLTFNGGTFEWEGTVSVTVPATAMGGVTGLRVRSRFSTALTAADAYLAYSFGETEEYLVNVIGVLSQNPALTYTWNTVPVTTTLSGASVSTGALAATTTYNVTVTDGLGCSTVSSNITVNVLPVNAAPTATLSTICAGGSTTLDANATGGGPFTYLWTDGTNTVGTTASISVSPATTTTYYVTVTDACSVSVGPLPVTVTVNPVPTSSIQEAGPITICDPLTQVLTAVTDGIAPTYQWRLNGVDIPLATNATYTVSGVGTGAYSVVVTSGLGCPSLPSTAVTVTINPSPSGVTVSASAATICAGETVDLFSSASAPSPTVLTQDFEAGIGSWTTTNLTTGTDPSTSAWTIQTNPYTAPNAGPFNSAGGTSFILSNPDDGGSGTAVNSLLTSPAFSTMGYSSLNLSLRHYYRVLSITEANVEVSTNGTTWTTVKTYTTTQGGLTAFVTDNISLNAYIGNPSVQVRFRYQNGWSWYWAIDDISVTGTPAAFNYSWTSTPAGFTSAVQNPTGAAPLVNTTYNVSISYAATGCATSGSTAVTVTECPSTLSLTAFLEGFYSDINTMRANIFDLGISADPTETDTLTINIWDPANLSSPTPDYTAQAVVHTDGTVDPVTFPAGLGGNSYYIAVKHRNHMETWSKLPVAFKPAVSYNFTTAQSQAYDDGVNAPMASVAGGKFAFYGGDTNQDGSIDATDQGEVDNDVALFAFGYNATDVTGDGSTDASDMQIVDNNLPFFLFYARPY